MAFLTDGQLETALAAALKVASVSDLDDYWDTIVPQANAAAYQEILGRLLRRGFTKAQVDAWDRGSEFQRDIGLYYALIKGGVYAGYDPRTVQALDRRKELDSVLVFVSGVWKTPEESPGTCGSGSLSPSGIFNFPDPTDPNSGEYTEW